MSRSNENFQTLSNYTSEKIPKRNLVASLSRFIPYNALKHAVPLKRLRGKRTDQIVLFILEVAVLEAVRRFSRARCPFFWNFVQALQVLGYPPFKWIQRWGPFRLIVKAVQKLSRPLLFLSITTAFSDHSDICKRTDSSVADPQQDSPDSPSSNEPSNSDMSICEESDDTVKDIVPENWLLKVLRELEREGITLPERIDEDELQRFYTATKGDLPCLISALKKTIRWRETYYLLSSHELEKWSTLVLWHGFDVMYRPCLVLRLGLACSSLSPHDRPRFAQAVVSQMEHGVLHLVNKADPRITVLIDCEGLSPIRFPMQMMQTCCTLVQDHYPNRLAVLLVIRLPAISRVISQTFMKILKPETREKLRIEGEAYHKVLSELLQSVPQFLGGKCNCPKCRMLITAKTRIPNGDETSDEEESANATFTGEPLLDEYPASQNPSVGLEWEHVLRAAVLGILMLWIVIAFLAGIYDSEILSQ